MSWLYNGPLTLSPTSTVQKQQERLRNIQPYYDVDEWVSFIYTYFFCRDTKENFRCSYLLCKRDFE